MRSGAVERNHPLDFVRGAAILGILLLNICAFGLPKAAYLNPAWRGFASTSDALSWALLDLFAQVKFLTIFALLFGAGLQLLLNRGARWIQSRLTLLVLLGFLHATLLWDGDILLAYGLVGLAGWRIIRDARSVSQLFNTGIVLYIMGIALLLILGIAAGSSEIAGWVPGAAHVQYEQYWKLRGGLEGIHNRFSLLSNNLLALGVQYGWQLMGLMLMGAALMRSGWLRDEYPLARYRRNGWLMVGIGLLIDLMGVVAQWQVGWVSRWCAFFLQIPREAGAPLQAIGYLSLAWGYWPWLAKQKLTGGIICVGRMALTNYLLQTLICTTLFYRFGLFLHYDRLTLLAFVPPVWAVNILFSVIWLRYFRRGPLEWLWRSLTACAADAMNRRS